MAIKIINNVFNSSIILIQFIPKLYCIFIIQYSIMKVYGQVCQLSEVISVLSMGNIIKELRIKNNLTQKEIADMLIMDTSYYCKIEQGKRNISDEYLSILSSIFNTNLLNIKNSLINFETFEDYINYYQLREAVENKEIDRMDELVELNKNNLKEGEPLLLKNYCKGVVMSMKYQEYTESNKLCFQSLNLSEELFENSIQSGVYSNSAYSMFVLITFNYNKLLNYNACLKICTEVLKHYNQLFSNAQFSYLNQDYFFKKTYTIFLNNYVNSLCRLEKFEEALQHCNNSIEKAVQFNILSTIYSLIHLKLEIQYNLGDLEGYQNTYNQYKAFCEITNKPMFLNEEKKVITENYVNINNHL